MKAVLQRVRSSSVSVDGKEIDSIAPVTIFVDSSSVVIVKL